MSALKVFAGIWLAVGCMFLVVLLWWCYTMEAMDEAVKPALVIATITAIGVSVPWVVGRISRASKA